MIRPESSRHNEFTQSERLAMNALELDWTQVEQHPSSCREVDGSPSFRQLAVYSRSAVIGIAVVWVIAGRRAPLNGTDSRFRGGNRPRDTRLHPSLLGR